MEFIKSGHAHKKYLVKELNDNESVIILNWIRLVFLAPFISTKMKPKYRHWFEKFNVQNQTSEQVEMSNKCYLFLP